MSRPVTEVQQRNRDEQVRLYGAALGELLGDVSSAFAVSQTRLAQLLGLSAPMVSQLASAHRVKVGNPAAMARLQRMLELARDVRLGRLDREAALAELDASRDDQILTRPTRRGARGGAASVQSLLRSVASAAELVTAAELLEPQHPALAEVLRVYGAGRSDEAMAHFERLVGPG